MLVALSEQPGIELQLAAAKCRGEAEEEVRALNVHAPFHRSAFDRLLQPTAASLCVPPGWAPGTALSERRRKIFRTLIQGLELFGGHPATLAQSADVCHSTYRPPSEVGWGIGTPALRVVTVHDLLPLTMPEFFPGGDNALLRRVLDDIRAGCVAHCVSEFTRRELIALLPEASSRSFVSPLAADRGQFFPRDANQVASICEQLSIRAPYVLCVGTLDPRKNLRLALEAFNHLCSSRKDVTLVITGASVRQTPSFQNLIDRYERAKAMCVLTGFVPDHHLPYLYAGASVVLFPSLAEGFGLPALEAMACGAPLIAANATSLPEVVGGGGMLLNPHDPEEWASAMASLLDSPQERARMSAAGLTRASQFSWKHTAEVIAAAYATFAGG
jgi:glycosyltransferase involved in cell wall biosynthesis